MKAKKLLILALPLLLAISACNATGGSSNQSSQESSSEPTPSRSEEPLPEKTPEEMEADARVSFTAASKMLKKSNYLIEGTLSNGKTEEPFIVVADNYFTMTQRALLDDGTVASYPIQVGYMANAHGVLRLRSPSYGNAPRPVGYALKTESYAEAKEFVKEHTVRLELDLAKWEYVANITGTACFKTTDVNAIKTVTTYLYGVEVSGKLSTVYAGINADGTSVTISVDADLPGRPTYFTAREIDLDRYLRGVTRESDDGDWRISEIAGIISRWQNAEISDTEFETFENFYEPRNYVPFPTAANRYYFYDLATDNKEIYDNSYRYFHIGFIDTGDISTSYGEQLLNNSWSLDAGETNKFSNGDRHITLRFVPAAETVNPQLYGKGIFYIDFSRD